ncbi:MAG TPA: DUF1559 domain-containing protein [Lacipirellulaceae bacterium]
MKLSPLLARRSRRGFTLVELLVVIAIIGILVALLLPAVQAAREAARRAQCQSNLKNVALAVLNYESQQKILPMGTQFASLPIPTIQSNLNFGESWAVSILPFIENQALYDSFVFEHPTTGAFVPMKDALNRDERGTELPVMLCPSDSNNRVKFGGGAAGDNWARGNYAANVGNGFMYSTSADRITGPNSPAWNGRDDKPPHDLIFKNYFETRGVMGPNVASTLAQITDGTSKTIMLAEVRAGLYQGDSRGTWAFGHAGGNLVVKYGSNGDANGPNFCGTLSDDVFGVGFVCDPNAEMLAQCMTCYGPGSADQATSRSAHVGGVFIALCDGSVQFISDDIETSGSYGSCCKPWDHLIGSIDSNHPGAAARPGRP